MWAAAREPRGCRPRACRPPAPTSTPGRKSRRIRTSRPASSATRSRKAIPTSARPCCRRGGRTALMYAARQGALAAARALVDAGADLDGRRSRRHARADVCDHQRALRRRDAAGRQGRRRQPRRPHGRDAALFGRRHAHAADVVRPARLPRGGDRRQRGDGEDAARARRRSNARLKARCCKRQHNAGDPSLGEGATPLMRAARAATPS